MFELGLLIAGAAAIGGYFKTRSFVRKRLRYVDGIQKSTIPVLAGAAAAVVAAPVVWILPIVGAPAALALGAGVGLGTRAGVRDIQNGTD